MLPGLCLHLDRSFLPVRDDARVQIGLYLGAIRKIRDVAPGRADGPYESLVLVGCGLAARFFPLRLADGCRPFAVPIVLRRTVEVELHSALVPVHPHPQAVYLSRGPA